MENKKINTERQAQIKKALRMTGKLDIPDELKKEGYSYRYFSSEVPHRLEQAKILGYTPVLDSKGKAYTIYGGVGERGKEYKLYLMKISLAEKTELDKIKNSEREKETESKMAHALVEGQNPDELYTKQGMGSLDTLKNKIKQL